MTGRAGGHVEARVGVEILPGAEGRIGHCARHRRIDGRQALARMVDVGEIGCDGLDVRFGKRGKAMHNRRHRPRRGPVQDTDAVAQIAV